MRRSILVLAASALVVAPPLAAQSTAPSVVERIIDEGTNRSQVMTTAQYLTDVIGPRLTNSPGYHKAEDWTMEMFRKWGLTNVHKEGFEFGRSWWVERANVRMTAPRPVELVATPVAWTPGTDGVVSAPVVLAPLDDDASLEKWKGKLAGKIVLISAPHGFPEPTEPALKRLSDEDLAKAAAYEIPKVSAERPGVPSRLSSQIAFPERRNAFLKAEGAVAFIKLSDRDGKLVGGTAYQFLKSNAPGVPGFDMAAEDYLRLARLTEIGITPELEVMSKVGIDDSNTVAGNIIADIPGTDPKAGYVMAGAHLDSWAAGDGAADNGAGTAVVMEAARIIKASGIRTKRTIRFALWGGEEQGLIGSMAYVEKHIATRPGSENMVGIEKFINWTNGWPITPGPDHGKLAAYFNLDNGSGRIRGINAQHNPALVPIFEQWFAPFRSMGAGTVSLRKVGGTDHLFFDAVGIPAFQFIQDPLDYGSRLHHTSIDTFDHLNAADMKQGAIILATFLVNAANADKPLPRLPFPTAPKPAETQGQ